MVKYYVKEAIYEKKIKAKHFVNHAFAINYSLSHFRK